MTSEPRVFFSAKKPATSHCFDFASRSLRAAELQMDRIWDRPVVSGSHAVVEAAFQDILIDIHFYFIALRNLYRFLAKVVDDPAFEQFRPDVEKLNSAWFKHYAKGREAFEHIDQRLPGEKQERQLVEVSDGGNTCCLNPCSRRPARKAAQAGDFERVFRAWHESSRVQVPTPDICRAEG